MSELGPVIDSLEGRINKLLTRLNQLENSNVELKKELDNANAIIGAQRKEITGLKDSVDSLKAANALLGSEENKRDTKLKINSLIREIDYCIAQLAE